MEDMQWMFNIALAIFDEVIISHPLLPPHTFSDGLYYCDQAHRQPVTQGRCLSKAVGRGAYTLEEYFKGVV